MSTGALDSLRGHGESALHTPVGGVGERLCEEYRLFRSLSSRQYRLDSLQTERDTLHPQQVCVRARQPVCAMQHLATYNGSLSCRPISRQTQPPPALPKHRGSPADADGSNTGFMVCGISSVTFRVPLQRRHGSGILRLEPMSDDRTRAVPPEKAHLSAR